MLQDNKKLPEDLYVEYRSSGNVELDEITDDFIRRSIESFGYKQVGSGYRLDTKMRDLHFADPSGADDDADM
jgi:hypothetical protein